MRPFGQAVMSRIAKADGKISPESASGRSGEDSPVKAMTAFVESCVETITGSAELAQRHAHARHTPTFKKLLRALKDKKNILISTHRYPDPDALASGWALCLLLESKMPEATISMSVRDQAAGGL